MKLYRVNLRGMTGWSTGTSYGLSYVIAEDSEKAYQKVKTFLDEKNLGFIHEREMASIDLIAEDDQYTQTKTMLFL